MNRKGTNLLYVIGYLLEKVVNQLKNNPKYNPQGPMFKQFNKLSKSARKVKVDVDNVLDEKEKKRFNDATNLMAEFVNITLKAHNKNQLKDLADETKRLNDKYNEERT